MGLDAVELVLALEEGFGVAISDGEAEVCITPALVIDLIFGKLRATDERVCVSQRAFYLLRKGLIQIAGVSRRNVTLSTDIRSIAAGRLEQQFWQDLQATVQARRWPALALPAWQVASLWLLCAGVFCLLGFAGNWAAAVICTLLLAAAAARSTQTFRSRIPARCSHVRDLVPFAATSNTIAWTRDQVASRVKKIVIGQLGLRETEYRQDAHFVKDLGLGQ